MIRFTVEGQGTVEARPGQTLVEAAQEGGLVLPVGCLSAKCGVCLVEAGEGLEPADNTSPACVTARKSLGPEKRLVEAETSNDGSQHAVNLVVGFESTSKVLQERLELRRA